MPVKEKKGKLASSNRRLNIQLTLIYFLLILLFTTLILFL